MPHKLLDALTVYREPPSAYRKEWQSYAFGAVQNPYQAKPVAGLRLEKVRRTGTVARTLPTVL